MAKLESSLILSLIDRVSGPARQVSATVSRLNAAAANNRRAIADMQGQMLGAVGAGYALYRGLSAPITAAIEFESAMADVAKVTAFDASGLDAYGKQLRALAVGEIPMAVTELAALSAEAAAAGIAQEDLYEFTRMTAKAAVAWGVSGAQAGEDLAKLKTALGLTIDETQSYADAINHLSDTTASTAPDLVDFSRRVAAQGEFFGFTKEQTLAFGSALISAGAESDVAATSFRNMGKALTKGSSATKSQSRAFKKLGLDSTKVAKAMQEDAVGTTLEVIDRIGQLPAHMQASVMSDLFGDEARALAPLLGDIDQLKRTLGLVNDEMAYAGSVGREFENRAKTTEYALQRFKNQVNDLGLTIGSILLPPFNDLLDVLGPLATKVAEFAEAHPELTRNVIAATAALIGFKVAVTGLRFLGLVGKGGAIDLMTIAFRGLIDPAKNASKAVGSMLALQGSLAAMQGAKYGGFAKLVDGAKALALAAPGMGIAKAALAAIGVALGAITLPVAAGIAAVAGAGFLIYKYWDRISSFVSGFASAIAQELQPALDAAKPLLDWFSPLGEIIGNGWNAAKSALEGIGGLISGLFAQEQLTEEQKAAFAQSGADLATAMADGVKAKIDELVEWFTGLADRIKAAVGNIVIEVGSSLTGPVNNALNGMAGALGAPSKITEPVRGAGGNTLYPVGEAPGFARGGRFNSGLAVVGEEGPELVEFGGPGNVHTASETRGILGGAANGGGRSVAITGPLIGSLQVTKEADVDAVIALLEQKLRDLFSGIQADMEYGVV
ncbi:phage tail tape measure protein [Devosia naphthalenivorans]|uniref:phage tail tape measure protein n=1 Tax=Devosia naphthalenivorans TaxID=2082392 RepID=UPI000D3D19D0|nr:phage tail tape measure protein [Devosia naphthalenivorans]